MLVFARPFLVDRVVVQHVLREVLVELWLGHCSLLRHELRVFLTRTCMRRMILFNALLFWQVDILVVVFLDKPFLVSRICRRRLVTTLHSLVEYVYIELVDDGSHLLHIVILDSFLLLRLLDEVTFKNLLEKRLLHQSLSHLV